MPIVPQQGLAPGAQQLFQPINQQPNQMPAAINPVIGKGSLIMFRYSFWVHDPVPLVIVTDFTPGMRLRGLNFHYLTYPYIRTLLSQTSGGVGLSYTNIKGDAYIRSAFRTYKWAGISQVKIFDSQFVLRMMAVARTFDPSQIRAIRQSVEQQLQQQPLAKAQETSPQPNSINNQG